MNTDSTQPQKDTTRPSRNQRSADSLVRAKLASGKEHADKAVRASEKSSRDATILRDSTAKVGAEERRGDFSLRPLRKPSRPLRLNRAHAGLVAAVPRCIFSDLYGDFISGLRLRLTWGQHHPKTEAGVSVRWEVVEAPRRPAVLRSGEPTAGPPHTVRSRSRPLRIRQAPAQIWAIPIPTPLPHVSRHVIQAPRVRQQLSHRLRHVETVVEIPGVVVQIGIARIIPVIEPRGRASPTGILPLRLRRQAVNTVRRYPPGSSLLRRPPRTIIGRIIPTRLLHRKSQISAVV